MTSISFVQEIAGFETYRVNFPLQVTNGIYHYLVGPNIVGANGSPLDQDRDGTGGEPVEDVYEVTFTIDTIGPRITRHTPAGDIAGTVEHVDVWFGEEIEPASFTLDDVIITGPSGNVTPTSVTHIGGNVFRIGFGAQTTVGEYNVLVGPGICDLAGNMMDQDRDGAYGEMIEDTYNASFNLVDVDITLSNVSVNPAEMWAGEPITVSWDGSNDSGMPLLGSWTDAVYLSTDNQWDIGDELLATVQHTGGLTNNEVYSQSATALVPGMLPGSYYIIVRADCYNQEKEGGNEGNNVVAFGPILLNVRPLLVDGVPVGGMLTAEDSSDYYAISAESGPNLSLILDTGGATGVLECFVSYEKVPTRLAYDHRSAANFQGKQQALVPMPVAGTYYVLVYGDQLGGTLTYNLTADLPELAVTNINPDYGGNVGMVTVTIRGGGFTQDTVASLILSPGHIIEAKRHWFRDESSMSATFDLNGATPGNYDVVLRQGTAEVSLPSIFGVTDGAGADFWTELTGPALVRVDQVQTYQVRFGNSGDVDLARGAIVISCKEGAFLQIDEPFGWDPGLGTDQGYDHEAGFITQILPPGSSNVLTFKVFAAVSGNITLSVEHWELPANRDDPLFPCDYHTKEKPLPPGERYPDGSIIFQYDPWFFLRVAHEGIVYHDTEGIVDPNNPGQWYVWENRHAWLNDPGGTRFTPWDDFVARSRLNDSNGFQGWVEPGLTTEELSQLKQWLFNNSREGGAPLEFYLDQKCSDSVYKAFREALGRDLITGRDIFWSPEWDWEDMTGRYWPAPTCGLWRIPRDFSEEMKEKIREWIRIGRILEMVGNELWQVVQFLRSWDPNDKVGPAGFGENYYVAPDATMLYTVYFENDPGAGATAPAQIVRIKDTLDEDLHLNTFELTEIAFADQVITVPPGLNHYNTRLNLVIDNEYISGKELVVDIDVSLDPNSRELTFQMIALDPETGWLPEDIMLGMLYPNDETGRGEGHISYIVKTKDGLASGTQITNRASIIFDWNDPIDTPLVRNTIDAGAPASMVLPLADRQTTTDFTVSWTGSDDTGGSGIREYDIYVSDNGGLFQLWLEDMPETSAVFTGEDQHTYAFYSIATDNVGHVEAPPGIPDAITTILLNRPPVADAGGPYTVPEGGSVELDASGTTDPDLPDEVLTYEWDLDGDGEYDDATGIYPTFSAALLDGPSSITVGLKVTDSYSEFDTNTAIVQVTNVAPSVSAYNVFVSVDEGQPATNSGSYSDPGDDTVTLTVSVGIIIDNGDGTWEWLFGTSDGPDQSQVVVITAMDSDGAETTTTFDLTVINVAPSLADAIFEIEENSPSGTIVGSVIGTDPGDDTLTYSIIGGIGASAFAIDAHSGQIAVADTTQLDYETTPSFTLDVQVVDDDGATDVATVTINLLNQASITGTVFVDINGNGVYEANEPGIDGIAIELLDDNGIQVLDAQNNPVRATT
ncbi:MAG: cadherin domain-containing protein, partial [Phycisphaerales bacterium]